MKFDTRDLISVSDASNRGVSNLVKEASEGRPKVVLRNNKPVAAVVGMDELDRLSHLDEIEDDLRLLSIAITRTVLDHGDRYTLDDVAKEFGVDLDADD